MVYKFLFLCSLLVVIRRILAEPANVSVFDKFHQKDYKVKFERFEIVSFNKDVYKRFEVVTFKYNRTCAVANLTFHLKIDVGNKLQVVSQVYKFMSNEYRYFPIRLQAGFCFCISKNIGGMGKFVNHCGNFTGCPYEKGKTMRVCNWAPDESELPPLLPEGRYMIEFQIMYYSVEAAVLRAYGEIYRPFSWQ